jgi:hypothetical protein
MQRAMTKAIPVQDKQKVLLWILILKKVRVKTGVDT